LQRLFTVSGDAQMDRRWAFRQGSPDKKRISGIVFNQKHLGGVHRPGGILNRLDGSVIGANIHFRVKAVPDAQYPLGKVSRFG
jgi:hypothetical protein